MAFALQIKQNLRPEIPCPDYPVSSLPYMATIFNAFSGALPLCSVLFSPEAGLLTGRRYAAVSKSTTSLLKLLYKKNGCLYRVFY
jgi:hypothetical protein